MECSQSKNNNLTNNDDETIEILEHDDAHGDGTAFLRTGNRRA